MSEANMKCFAISVWIHHMNVDQLFDFLHERITEAPPYWFSEAACPPSVTGGYVLVTLTYDQYDLLRNHREWDFDEFNH